MSEALNLLKLLNSAPKDEKNTLIPDPRTDAFLSALAKATPLTPLQLLEIAEHLNKQKSPELNGLGRSMLLQAVGDMGHDRRMLEILSKVADEQTSWGLTGRELLKKITKSFHGVSERYTIGVGGFNYGEGGAEQSYEFTSSTFTALGSGCTYQPASGPAVTIPVGKTRTFYSDNPETLVVVTCEPILDCLFIKTTTWTIVLE